MSEKKVAYKLQWLPMNVQITGTSTVCLVVALFKRTPVQRARLRIYGPLWLEVICHTGSVMRDWSPCHDVTSINSALTRHDNVIIFTILVFTPEGILCLAFPFCRTPCDTGSGHDPTHWRRDARVIIVRRAGLLWSQQDFEWRWSVPLFKCLTVLEFSFILFDLCLLITFFNFIMNYVPIVTFLIFTYHKIWILSIMFCSIWSYWIIYFLACLEVSWRVVS